SIGSPSRTVWCKSTLTSSVTAVGSLLRGPGFYRENRGLFTGRCVPCSCNGNSNRCQDGSGICINCQYNTAGEKCDRCKEGYFGDATQGSCRVCPCPYTNSFATGCVANGEEVQCFCKEGYTGIHCESCAPGYFGNPLKYGGYCQKCNCNNNGQLSICDRLTGECLNQEPKDVDPDEDCDACDSCVIILLKDLSTMGDELQLIKSQLQNVDASAHTLGQMRHLETRIKDNLQQSLFNNFGQTNQKGKDLVSKIQIIITNIHVLLEQIAGTNSEGNTLPVGDAAKELAEAEQMMREMRNRNFQQLQIDAEKEKREAQLLLEQVRRDLQTHQQENHGVVKTIRDSLNEYEAKLSDLREILKEATGQTKQAESLNKNNGVLLADIKRQIEVMNKQQNDVLDHLSSAQSSLSQTNGILALLQKSKEEYENLAAKLDGARKDMNEKLKSLSLSASKEPLVVRAEEHVKFLQDLAKQLAEIKRNTSNDELVSCAMEAATAYENIINAIKAAEEAANKAENAADSALLTVEREDLAGKAKRLNTESNNLLNRAQGAQKTLQDINPTLEDIKQKLDTVEGKKNRMLTDLVNFKNDLNGINRGDVESIITRAKNMVKNANGITTNVLDELNPIKADVEKIKDTYGSNQSADFNKALTEANNSVKKLTNKLPDLFNKIESINQQLIPIGNISENVNRIRELIHQARDAANKVAVPMRFNGRSGVEVRPPSDLEDLKGYTSLSFFLQRPRQRLDSIRQTPNMFVMYLGNKDASKDYIGMAVKNGHLICVYNLGGNEAEIEVDSSVTESYTEEAILDRVKFERIYQYATLNYVKAASSDKGTFYSNSGSSHTLLNLDPNSVVFYVGGYPSDFTPPDKLDYPHYQGCIELDNLNENVISLYNFKKTFNLNTAEVEPCSRYKAESDENYFEGTGYALVIAKETNIPNLIYEQTIQTTADEGMVFFAENQVTIKLYISGREKLVVLKHGIEAKIKTFSFTKYYLGGIPSSLRERFNISTPPFRGCMRNVRDLISGSVTFTETMGVSRKCSDDWKVICKVAFNVCRHSQETRPVNSIRIKMQQKGTYMVRLLFDDLPMSMTFESQRMPRKLSQPIKFGGDDFEGCISNVFIQRYLTWEYFQLQILGSHFSVDVRTVSSGGLIFFVGNKPESSYMALYISKGRFVFSFGAGGKKLKIKSKTKYNDGQWHTVVFSMDGKNGRLVIDGLRAREGKLAGNSTVSTKPPIYLGGLPALKIQNIPRKSFVGCVRNFKMNGKLMNAPHRNTGVLPCLDGSLETGIYFFNEGGYIIIDNSFMLGLEFEIVFNIRMRSLTGVLLHTGNEQSNYLTVYMEAGKVTASGNNGAGEFKISISPQQSMCDGQWHSITGTVSYHLSYFSFFLIFTANLETPWLPVRDSFHGCLQNIKINDKPVSVSKISEVHGVVSLHGCPAN
uniref:Laminin subunit alpha 3 n=1 Tax=Pelusios castaneus TaxID=367368 RepID=A0A8C8SJJ4_9SAUR